MQTAFYILFGLIGLLGAYFVAGGVLGHLTFGGAPRIAAKAVLLLAAAAGGSVCCRAYLLGELQGRHLYARGAVILAVLAFQAVLVKGRISVG